MSDENQVQLGLSALLLLTAYLSISIGWRRRKLRRQQLADRLPDQPGDGQFRRHWQSQVFDASSIAPQVQQIRRDPVSAIRHRPWHAGYHQLLLASARETILNLAYFQLAKDLSHGKTEGEAQKRID